MKSAFTLVELSVILVVIGLVVGGIMVGRNLIESGRIRAQITQISDIETQINTFKVKYNCLPGDCSNATEFLGTTFGANTVRDGDGDGIIRSLYTGATPYNAGECTEPAVYGEISQLLLQLNATGLGKYTANGRLNGGSSLVGVEYTATAYDNTTGFFISCLSSLVHPTWTPLFFRTGNIIVVGSATTSVGRVGYAIGTYGTNAYATYGGYGVGLALNPIGIPADVVRQIDEKIDDGSPSKGKFGIITGDSSCAANVAAYPSPSTYCRATAGKKIN